MKPPKVSPCTEYSAHVVLLSGPTPTILMVAPVLKHVVYVSRFLLWFVLGPGGLPEAPGDPGKAHGGL